MKGKWPLAALAMLAVVFYATVTQGKESWGTKFKRCGLPTLSAAGQCWYAGSANAACLGTAPTPAGFLTCQWAAYNDYACLDEAIDAGRCWDDEDWAARDLGAADVALKNGQWLQQSGKCIKSAGRPSSLIQCPLSSYRGARASITTAQASAGQLPPAKPNGTGNNSSCAATLAGAAPAKRSPASAATALPKP